MKLDLQTLAGVLVRGREVVNMLAPAPGETPGETARNLLTISSDREKLGRLINAVSVLENHLRVLGVTTIIDCEAL